MLYSICFYVCSCRLYDILEYSRKSFFCRRRCPSMLFGASASCRMPYICFIATHRKRFVSHAITCFLLVLVVPPPPLLLFLLLFPMNWVIRIIARFAMRFVPLGDIALRFGKYLGRSNHPKNPLEDFRR